MNRSDDDAQALRAMASELGLRRTPPPAEPATDDVDEAWVEGMLDAVVRRARGVAPRDDAEDVGDGGALVSPHQGTVLPRVGTPRRSPVRRGWFALAAGVALLLGVGGSIVVHPQEAVAAPPLLSFSAVAPGSPTPTSGTPARAELLALADVAGRQPAAPRSPLATVQHVSTQQWRLEVTHGADDVEAITVRPTADDSWLGPDGDLRLREVATAPEFSPTGELVGRSTPGDLLRNETVRAGERGAAWPSTLPRDPGALFERLVAASQASSVVDPTPPTSVLLAEIEALFGRWVVPPDLTSSLWVALADRPDVRSLGQVTDRAGRAGQGFSHWNAQDKTLEVVIIDPVTGSLLATEGMYFPPQGADEPADGAKPVVSSFTTYLSVQWVPAP